MNSNNLEKELEAVAKRVYARTVPGENGCLVFTGHKNNGYARIHFNGKPRNAHRMVYIAAYGEPPEGYQIDHICKNRACVNLEHLRAVTRWFNIIMNSDSPSAINARKTHCSNCGGEFVKGNSQRYCLKCKAEATRKRSKTEAYREYQREWRRKYYQKKKLEGV